MISKSVGNFCFLLPSIRLQYLTSIYRLMPLSFYVLQQGFNSRHSIHQQALLFLCLSTCPQYLPSIQWLLILCFYVFQQDFNSKLRYIGENFPFSMSFNKSLIPGFRYINRDFSLSMSFNMSPIQLSTYLYVLHSFNILQEGFNTRFRYIDRLFYLSMSFNNN